MSHSRLAADLSPNIKMTCPDTPSIYWLVKIPDTQACILIFILLGMWIDPKENKNVLIILNIQMQYRRKNVPILVYHVICYSVNFIQNSLFKYTEHQSTLLKTILAVNI